MSNNLSKKFLGNIQNCLKLIQQVDFDDKNGGKYSPKKLVEYSAQLVQAIEKSIKQQEKNRNNKKHRELLIKLEEEKINKKEEKKNKKLEEKRDKK